MTDEGVEGDLKPADVSEQEAEEETAEGERQGKAFRAAPDLETDELPRLEVAEGSTKLIGLECGRLSPINAQDEVGGDAGA